MKPALSSLAALSLSLLLACPVLAVDRQTLHTAAPAVAARLQRLARLSSDERLQLAIGLPLHNPDQLTNLINQLYNPASPKFHQYLTPDQFTGQFDPTEQEYQAVINFAKSNHLEILHQHGNRALLDVAGRVDDLEKMFHVSFGLYQHPTEPRVFYAPDTEPSIEGGPPISFVVGLDDYVKPRPNVREITRSPQKNRNQPGIYNGSGTNSLYLGNDFRRAYIPSVSLKGQGQTVGLVEYTGYTPGDITQYEALAGYSATPLVTIVLPGATGLPCTNCGSFNREVALDIEMVIAMAPQATVLIVEGIYDTDTMNELAHPTYGEALPRQISSSWTSTLDPACETALLEMATQGQSMFLCSFDAGAPTNGVQSSVTDENYLTMVGGTELSMNGAGVSWQSEVVWGAQFGDGSSTGYIETALAIPYYQRGVNTTANGGSSIYRNVPDVAMCADNIETVITQTFTNKPPQTGIISGSAGTSAAAPLWAAFTALINQQAASQGTPAVGFINPALYSIAQGPLYASCFHDVTNGNNTNVGSANLYFAGRGYDNCTGLGSPTGASLMNAILGLASPTFVNFNYTGGTQNGLYDTPFKTLAQGVTAVSNYGTIFIETAGSSHETMTISKRMTITASDGAATIGH